MTRKHFHLIVDVTMFLAMLALVATGMLMSFVLPPRSGGASVWTLTRHDWGNVHFWIAATLLGLLVLHLVLNWSWVCTVAIKAVRPRVAPAGRWSRCWAGAAAVALVAAALAGFLWAANQARQSAGRGEGQARGRHAQADHPSSPSEAAPFVRAGPHARH